MKRLYLFNLYFFLGKIFLSFSVITLPSILLCHFLFLSFSFPIISHLYTHSFIHPHTLIFSHFGILGVFHLPTLTSLHNLFSHSIPLLFTFFLSLSLFLALTNYLLRLLFGSLPHCLFFLRRLWGWPLLVQHI